MPLSKLVVEFLGTEDYDDDMLDAKIGELLTENATLKTDLQGANDKKDELDIKLNSQGTELEKLKPMAEVGETYLADMRKEAEAKYKLLKGDEASESMIKLIQNADIEQAKTYRDEFAKEIEEKIPGICSECGKEATLIRRSSKELQEERKKEADISSYKMGPVR